MAELKRLEPALDAALKGAETRLRALEYQLLQDRYSELSKTRRLLDEVELAARVHSDAAELGTFRQAFILLMTIFDAAVFDIIRDALRSDFFGKIALSRRIERSPWIVWRHTDHSTHFVTRKSRNNSERDTSRNC